MVEKQKILFCGDVEGRFITLFNRVETLNKKSGPFDMLLCVGNFFGINNKEFEVYKLKIKQISVPTYILGPNNEDHVPLYPAEGSELCPNVTYLGRRGLYTNTGGIKIAYLSGIATTSDSTYNSTYMFNADDLVFLHDAARKGNSNYKGLDVLITSQWPNDVNRYDTKYKLCTSVNRHTDLVAWLQMQLRPRYHIAGLEGLYYERPPYRILNSTDNDALVENVTRFLGLARVGNPNKDKWLYALSLTPLDKMNTKELLQKTTDETVCPFNLLHLENTIFKNKRKTQESKQYFYDMNTYEETNKEKKAKRPKVIFDNSKCWFCLANPAAEKHLVITVGNLVYLALAKGGLVDEHLLICPIEHHQSSVGLPEDILEEVEQFKNALAKMYASNQKVPVFFERNFKTAHMQIQAVPIPKQASQDLVDIFKDEANGHSFELKELNSKSGLNQVIQPGTPYFCVDLPTGTTLYTTISKSINFPINFGREVLASEVVLNLPTRADWRECNKSDDQVDILVKNLRTTFAPFDFTS